MANYYSTAASNELGERAFDAALGAIGALRSRPASGSARLGQLCGIPSLRAKRVPGFPMQWFYFDREDCVDVVRLLGDRQDIVAILRDGANTSSHDVTD
ncbi:MAG: type II toxin-antitoxin system RelE/ParE family toxin [Ramlibacter sp.]|nr:type II toxin-antitoxin system RelE/ParE family toxin [Ramlibacter sp.]